MLNAVSVVSIVDGQVSKVSIYLQRFGHGEKGQMLAWVSFGLSCALWIPALATYFMHNSDSEVSTIYHQCKVVRVQNVIVTALFICQPPHLHSYAPLVQCYSGSVFCHLRCTVFMYLSCVVMCCVIVPVRCSNLSSLLCCRAPHQSQGPSTPCAVSWGCLTTTTSGTSAPPLHSSYSLL